MIDLHCHLLPGVDDGAESIEVARAMLRQAEADGIETIVVTPHALSALCRDKDLEALRRSWEHWLPQLRHEAGKVVLKTGAEVFFTSDLGSLLKEHSDLLTINDTSYFMLEFPHDYIYAGSREFIYKIMTDGFIPIISHAERNSEIQRAPKILDELVQAGALCQVNAGSLRGDFGEESRRTASELLRLNLVHVIASDAHDSRSRKPELSYVRGLLRPYGAERADLYLQEIPEAILANEAPPDIGPSRSDQQKRSFFGLFQKGKS